MTVKRDVKAHVLDSIVSKMEQLIANNDQKEYAIVLIGAQSDNQEEDRKFVSLIQEKSLATKPVLKAGTPVLLHCNKNDRTYCIN